MKQRTLYFTLPDERNAEPAWVHIVRIGGIVAGLIGVGLIIATVLLCATVSMQFQ